MPEDNQVSYGWRELQYQKFYEVVDQVTEDIQSLEWSTTGKSMRRLRGLQLERLSYSVERLIRDSVAIVLHRKRMSSCPISKSKMRYEGDRADTLLTYDIFIKRAYRGMIELGYLYEVSPGFNDRNPAKGKFSRSRLTRYRADDPLIDLFTEEEQQAFPVIVPPKLIKELIVQQKVATSTGFSKVRLDFEETPETHQMRENLLKINRVVSRSWIDLEVTNKEMLGLQADMVSAARVAQGKDHAIDLSRKASYRVFNDPEFKTGGRFYGGWWQNIPKKYRSMLLINGKRTVEFDYSNLHPTILYLQEGIDPPEDSYSLIIDQHFKRLKFSRDLLREMLKKSFNAMLNAKAPMKSPPDGVVPKDFGLKWLEVSTAVLETHSAVAHHFYTGAGSRLQLLDSQVAEAVMLHFAELNIPILPLHDSFLMHHGYERELPEVMKKVFAASIFGDIDIDKKVKAWLSSTFTTSDAEEVAADPMELLSVGYFQREAMFFKMRDLRQIQLQSRKVT